MKASMIKTEKITSKTGQEGEKLAVNHLIKKGYHILEKNWRFGKKEIDIIALYQEKLIIVEVKTRTSLEFENPKEAVTLRKQQAIISAAEQYILLKNIQLETRFDVISVLFLQGKTQIEHLEEAFYPTIHK